jgi:hypothetical protein
MCAAYYRAIYTLIKKFLRKRQKGKWDKWENMKLRTEGS